MGSKIGKMIARNNNTSGKKVIPFGRVASGNSVKTNIQNNVGGEARELKMIAPYGISSCPTDGLFAQMIVNDDVNNVCVGVHNPSAPVANAGEIVLYSHGGATIKLSGNSVLINGVDVLNEINLLKARVKSLEDKSVL